MDIIKGKLVYMNMVSWLKMAFMLQNIERGFRFGFLFFFLCIEGKRYKLIKHTVFCNGTCKIFDKDKMIVF